MFTKQATTTETAYEAADQIRKELQSLQKLVDRFVAVSPRITDASTVRCGDVVYHVPSKETWVVAYAEGDVLAWTGWPDGLAKLSDCVLLEKVDDKAHAAQVKLWAECVPGRGEQRCSRVLELYGKVLTQ